MSDGLEYLGRARLQGLALLVIVFLVGVLAGASADRLWTRPRPHDQPRPPRTEGATRLPRVFEDMDLTAHQRAAIESVLASGKPRNDAVVSPILPRLRAISDSLHRDIRALLTPRQVEQFDAYLRTHAPKPMTLPSLYGGPGGDRDRQPRGDSGDPGEPRPRGDEPPREGREPPPGPPPPRPGGGF